MIPTEPGQPVRLPGCPLTHEASQVDAIRGDGDYDHLVTTCGMHCGTDEAIVSQEPVTCMACLSEPPGP